MTNDERAAIGALLAGLGGGTSTAGEMMQRDYGRKKDEAKRLAEMRAAQLLEQSSPMYAKRMQYMDAQMANMGRGSAGDRLIDRRIAAEENRAKMILDRESAEKSIVADELKGARARYEDEKSALGKKSIFSMLSEGAKQDAGIGSKEGTSIMGLLTAPARAGTRLLDYGLSNKPMYSTGGEYAEEGILPEPKTLLPFRQSVEELEARQTLPRNRAIQDILYAGGPEKWAETQVIAPTRDNPEMDPREIQYQRGLQGRLVSMRSEIMAELQDPAIAQSLTPIQMSTLTALAEGRISLEDAERRVPGMIKAVEDMVLGGTNAGNEEVINLD